MKNVLVNFAARRLPCHISVAARSLWLFQSLIVWIYQQYLHRGVVSKLWWQVNFVEKRVKNVLVNSAARRLPCHVPAAAALARKYFANDIMLRQNYFNIWQGSKNMWKIYLLKLQLESCIATFYSYHFNSDSLISLRDSVSWP